MAVDLELTWPGRGSSPRQCLASVQTMKVGAIDQPNPGASLIIEIRNLVIKSRGQ